MTYDNGDDETLHILRRLASARAALLLGAAAAATLACQRPAAQADAAETCVPGARFHGEIYGTLATVLDWRGGGLRCEGMPRPRDAGARLRFAGPAGDDGQSIAFILALPDLAPGQPGNELPATVTVIAEDYGRFFSNAENPVCWSDVTAQEALGTAAGSFRVSGIVYCMAPLAEQGGNGSVRLGEITYTGRVDWGSDH